MILPTISATIIFLGCIEVVQGSAVYTGQVIHDVAILQSRIDGEIFLRGEEGYEEAARIRNTLYSNDPLVVVMAAGTGRETTIQCTNSQSGYHTQVEIL